MKFPWIVGIASALFLHALVLLFGGLVFGGKGDEQHALQTVDLLGDLEAEKKPEEKQPEEEPEQEPEEIETETEKPPDAAEMLRTLDAPDVDDTPALDAASLSALEAALGGQGGGESFGEALSFASGGRIGATGQGLAEEGGMEDAFSLAELDQKPRAVHQVSPSIPPEMRGKKLEGTVSLIFIVDDSGRVQHPRVDKSSHEKFETPALNALKQWKFEPGVKGGQRVPSRMRVTIRFPPS